MNYGRDEGEERVVTCSLHNSGPRARAARAEGGAGARNVRGQGGRWRETGLRPASGPASARQPGARRELPRPRPRLGRHPRAPAAL